MGKWNRRPLPLLVLGPHRSYTFLSLLVAASITGLDLAHRWAFCMCRFSSKPPKRLRRHLLRNPAAGGGLPALHTSANNHEENSILPVILWPSPTGPFSAFQPFGWQWQANHSVDDNLVTLAFANRLNCFKMKGYTSGQCSAMLCRPPRHVQGIEPRGLEIEIIGFGVNAPPRFAQVSTGGKRKIVIPSKKQKHEEIHAEMQIIARCAREGISVKGAWLYVALPPCWECCKAILAAGVARVLCQAYSSGELAHGSNRVKRQQSAAQAAGVEWIMMDRSTEREAYVDNLWEQWKERNNMDRAAIKTMGSEAPL